MDLLLHANLFLFNWEHRPNSHKGTEDPLTGTICSNHVFGMIRKPLLMHITF
jgi:hypothetical protein